MAPSSHPLYPIWNAMKSRCYLISNEDYPNYGGRGIYVCEDWKNNFQKFLADMGERPPKYTLERKNVDGPYSKENCEWATQSEQNRNQRRRAGTMSDEKIVKIFDSQFPVWMICKQFDLDKKTVWKIKNKKYGHYAVWVCTKYKWSSSEEKLLERSPSL